MVAYNLILQEECMNRAINVSPRRGLGIILNGIVAVLIGGYIIFQPADFATLVAIIVGVYIFVNGVLTVWSAIRDKSRSDHRGMTLARGVMGILVGAIALALPFMFASITWTIILYVIAAQLVVSAIMEFVVAGRMRGMGLPMMPALIGGLFSLIFAFILFYAPGVIAVATLRIIGAIILFIGIGLLVLGFRLRR
jgi:uncharacterized membrane protein HdeD (DUF308 family)